MHDPSTSCVAPRHPGLALTWIIGGQAGAFMHRRVMPHSRRLWLGLLILILAAGGYAWWRGPNAIPAVLLGRPAQPVAIVVSGNIEAHESVLSFTQIQAPITELPFDEGATVAKDTVLARVDDSLYRRQTEIDRANLGSRPLRWR